jgi:hypothetical protein
MLAWLRKLRGGTAAPLRGAPAVRRLKTYSAASGYVYQYFYEGNRHAVLAGEPGTEYAFQTSADRKTYRPVTVFVSAAALDRWQGDGGRELSSSECYAIAKMALFQAFDERPTPAGMGQPVRVRPADLADFAERLDLL